MNENKKYILDEFLRDISHIRDREYQERIWIRNEGPECQAFDDVICDFFDIGDPILDNYKDYGITEDQYRLLKKFRDKFEVFSDENYWPPSFIDSPEWAKIMEMAKEVLKAFDYEKKTSTDNLYSSSTEIMEVNGEKILNSIFENIKGIASKDYQKRSWALGEGSSVDNMDEICSNFLGKVDPVLEKYEDYGITEDQYRLLKKFRDELEAFSDEHYWPEEFIDSPEWAKIREMAREVLKAFNYTH